eukprot:11200444-Lingulodinium_polyedra.AAC.1
MRDSTSRKSKPLDKRNEMREGIVGPMRPPSPAPIRLPNICCTTRTMSSSRRSRKLDTSASHLAALGIREA